MMPERLAYGLALAGYFGLLSLWIIWSTRSDPSPHPPTAFLLMTTTLPLLACLRGLLHNRRSTFIWLGLLSLLYFIHGVGTTVMPDVRALAIAEAAFSLSLFLGAVARLKSTPASAPVRSGS